MLKDRKVIILGSGPAGLTAAIYASRAGLKPLVIEGAAAGGQLMTTTDVENFPGFPEGITGPELIANMRAQAEKFGTEFITLDAEKADISSRPSFRITAGGEEYTARTLIIATGATARYMDLKSVERLRGRGVSACATCDGFFFRDKTVYMVGGGDSAMEEAQFLTQFAASVTVIHRRDELRASKIMQDNAKANPKIQFLLSHILKEVTGSDRVSGVRVEDLKSGEIKELPADGVFFAIGHNPATTLFRDQLDLDDQGYIVTTPGRMTTKVEGVFSQPGMSATTTTGRPRPPQEPAVRLPWKRKNSSWRKTKSAINRLLFGASSGFFSCCSSSPPD